MYLRFTVVPKQQAREVYQLVDSLVWDQEAAGSSPVFPTTERRIVELLLPATPAQQEWKVGEWLKPADCKSAPLRVRRFESVPSN